MSELKSHINMDSSHKSEIEGRIFFYFKYFFLFFKYNWHTILDQFQAYNPVVGYLYKLLNDHPDKSRAYDTIHTWIIIDYIPFAVVYFPMTVL